MMTSAWLTQSQNLLTAAGISTARLDTLVLLEDVTGKDRGWLLAHPEFEISGADDRKLKKLLNLRAKHMPLAYVRGKTEFYGREFVLTPAVLEPRPESETMIDLLKKLYTDDLRALTASREIWLADVGTGSGALGITAALELPKLRIELLEIDQEALGVAQINIDKYTTGITTLITDLLARTKRNYDILLCNLPYVPDDYQINTAALHEPRIAIFGGPDGLDIYRKLFKQLQKRPLRPLFILTESLPFQHKDLQSLAAESGHRLRDHQDFIQVFELVKK